MSNVLAFFGLFTGFLVAMVGCLEIGRRVGRRAFARDHTRRPAGLATVETVTFGLLGLLLAFTFSGAADRFDRRRAQIVEEANMVGTAWLRLDLLPAASQPKLRDAFRRYADARIETYRLFSTSGLGTARAEYDRSAAIQGEIWSQAVAAARDSQPVTMLLLPALNEMIDITSTRMAATEMHPPLIVYFVLLLISLACCLLVGFEMGASAALSWAHVLVLAAMLAFTLCVILDFEYPRLGLIRIDDLDKMLVQVRAAMN